MLRHRVPGLRPFATLCATALTLTCAPLAWAEPPAEPEGAPAESGLAPEIIEAQRLYNLGRARFETADYQAAIKMWTDAYAQLPDTADGKQVKVLLIYNIATAREKAFDVSKDPAELRQAKILLGNFQKSITTLYGEGAEADAERDKVATRIAEIDARLAAYEEEQKGDDEPDPAPPDPTPVEPDPEPTGPDPSARGLLIGGAVAAGLGVAALAVMGTGLGMGAAANDISDLEPDDIGGRRDRFDRGRTGNTLAIAGGIAGGVLLVTGGVLLGLGAKRRQGGGTVSVAPALGPGGSGLVLRARF